MWCYVMGLHVGRSGRTGLTGFSLGVGELYDWNAMCTSFSFISIISLCFSHSLLVSLSIFIIALLFGECCLSG